MTALDTIMRVAGAALTYPGHWPLWVRRTFLLGLPITLPLWLAFAFAGWLVIFVIVMAACLGVMAVEIWKGKP